MDQPFFITGYPRSMTAWLSVALDCAHERDGDPIEEFMQKLDSGEQVGNAESTIVFFFDVIKERWPDSRWVIIEREKEESLSSLCKVSDIAVEKMRPLFDAIEAHISSITSVLVVKFSEILYRIKEIWEWCRPLQEFPEQRIKRLQILNIQQNPSLIREVAKLL